MRSKPATPHQILAEPVFNSVIVSKLINRVMLNGKKGVAEKQVYKALDIVKNQTKSDPIVIFSQAIDNIQPQMEVRPRRIGGAAYQVPVPVRTARKTSLAIRWLVQAAKSRPNSQFHSLAQKLAAEIIDAANVIGGAVKKKLDTHRMAEANKAFAHFRW